MSNNDLYNIKLHPKADNKIVLQVKSASASSGSGVLDVSKNENGIVITNADETQKVIKVVQTKDGQLVDECGNVLLPYPIQVVILGDSEV